MPVFVEVRAHQRVDGDSVVGVDRLDPGLVVVQRRIADLLRLVQDVAAFFQRGEALADQRAVDVIGRQQPDLALRVAERARRHVGMVMVVAGILLVPVQDFRRCAAIDFEPQRRNRRLLRANRRGEERNPGTRERHDP